MDSLLNTTKGSKAWIPPSFEEPKKFKFAKFLNMLALNVFLLYYILNFIMIGFDGIYALIMIISALNAFGNILFVIAKKEYQMKSIHYIKILYVATFLSVSLCIGFFIYGLMLIGEKDENYQILGKWMVIFSVLYIFESITFLCFARQCKQFFEDHPQKTDSESEDEETDSNHSDI